MRSSNLSSAKPSSRFWLNRFKCRKPRLPRRKQLLFEPLEPRLLLSGDPFHTAALATAGVDLTLRLGHQDGVETRQLLDTDAGESYFRGQVVYLDADGAQDVTYQGPVTVADIDVSAFQAPEHFTGQEQAILESLLDFLQRNFTDTGLTFTTQQLPIRHTKSPKA